MASISSIVASMALITSAIAAGATQDMCYGFSSGSGYNVELMIESLQSQSTSSICGSFNDVLQNQFSFCSPGAVNCHTSDDGGLVTIGVSTSDSQSGFSCVTAAFTHALQASVIPGPIGLSCTDLDQFKSSTKRSRIERPLNPRAINSPSGTAQIGDQITVASGRTLTLTALNLAAGNAPALVGGFFTSLVPEIATKIGTTGLSIGNSLDSLSPWSVRTFFDAGVNGGPGNFDANDWQNIVGSLSHALAENAGADVVEATFTDTATNLVVLTVAFLIL